MVLAPYTVSGLVYASDGSTRYPDVSVTLRNTTTGISQTQTTESDGSFSFVLANFVGGYSNGDSLKLEGKIGCFYQSTTLTVDTSKEGEDTTLTLAAESVTGIVDLFRLKEELVVFFRQRLVDPKDRGSNKTNVQSGTGSKVKFELPEETTITAIRSVLINDALQTNYTDYYVDYNDKYSLTKPVVYFLTPPANNATVQFDYQDSSYWIFPDVPRADLSLDSYPRVGIGRIIVRTKEDGLHADGNLTDFFGSIVVRSAKENELNSLITDIRTLIRQNKKKFHYFKLIIPQGAGSMIPQPGREEKILQMNQDFLIFNRLEII